MVRELFIFLGQLQRSFAWTFNHKLQEAGNYKK